MSLPDKNLSKYFLPYQVGWITDERRLLICEKSIRIGLTFGESFRAVRNRMRGKGNYLHTTVNERMAKKFIKDCKNFCEVYDIAASDISEMSVYNPLTDRQESAFEIYFEKKKVSIKAFGSNPDALRGEGGEVGIDEITSHQQPDELMKAAGGRAMWGYSVRVWSSHKGAESSFNRLLQQERAKGKASRWAIVSIDLNQALDQGLLEKINEVQGTNFTREEFIKDTIAMVGGEEAFEEECLLKPRLGGSAAIKWQYITAARQKYDILRFDITGKDEGMLEQIAMEIVKALQGAQAHIGYDVARTGHLSAVWVNKNMGRQRRLDALVKIEKMKFADQRRLVEAIMEKAPQTIGGGDKTGLGMQVCEELEEKFGTARFIGMNFGAMKPELGTNLVRAFEQTEQIIPEGTEHDDIAYDLAGIQNIVLPSGRTSFYESSNPIDKRSHCDMAWAGAMANLIAKDEVKQGMW